MEHAVHAALVKLVRNGLPSEDVALKLPANNVSPSSAAASQELSSQRGEDARSGGPDVSSSVSTTSELLPPTDLAWLLKSPFDRGDNPEIRMPPNSHCMAITPIQPRRRSAALPTPSPSVSPADVAATVAASPRYFGFGKSTMCSATAAVIGQNSSGAWHHPGNTAWPHSTIPAKFCGYIGDDRSQLLQQNQEPRCHQTTGAFAYNR